MKIRKSNLDDEKEISKLASYCFGYTYSDSDKPSQEFLNNIHEFYTVEEAGRFVANARCIKYEQNIRGSWKLMGGLSGVINSPETRRKGYIRALTLHMFHEMHEAGIATSTLFPAINSFYTQFGYVSGPPTLWLQVNPLRFQRWKNPPSGYRIERMAFSEGVELFKVVHEKAIQKIHGGIRRSEQHWKYFTRRNRDWLAVVFNPEGDPEGIIQYVVKGFSNSPSNEGEMKISNIYWLTKHARAALFHYFYLHSFQIIKLSMPLNPNEAHYYSWLEGVTACPQIRADELIMVRVVNVCQSLQDLPSKYAGEIKLQILDPLCSWNNQAFRIMGDGQKLNIEALGNKNTSLQLTIEGLSALIYGILPIEEVTAFQWLKGIKNPDKDLLTQWFPVKIPWITDNF
ncbi:MAG: enhanced intracellular survival protein Eis [Candidatus Hermodarchaeota archaeon]